MRRTLLLFISIVYGAMLPTVFAQTPPPSDSTQIQREVARRVFERFGFRPHSGTGATVTRDGIVTGLRGIPVPSDSTFRLRDWAYDFLERNADLFGVANPRQELRLLADYGNGIEMGQVVNGVEVYLTRTRVELSADRSYISGVDVHYYPEARSINTTPTIDSLEAGRIAQADPAHGANTYACCYKLWISSTYDGAHSFASGGTHLVWQFSVGGGIYNGAEYMVDAHTGEILSVQQGWR